MCWILSVLLVGCAVAAAQEDAAEPAAEATRQGPLAKLPSKPGPHVAKIQAMGENQWLVLGAPAPDPTWGRARGRSWSSKMAFAPDLEGAFLFGEGVHGWWNRQTGRYMDDLWFYDASAHRWICAYPGTDCRNYNMVLNDDGFEATADGRPVPVASMVHGYEMLTYDTDTKRFMSMPCPGGYWKAIQGRRALLAKHRDRLNETHASPWLYDTRLGRWDRVKTKSRRPPSSFGDTLIYLAPHKKTFFFRRGQQPAFYDAAGADWTTVKAAGPPPPFGIDPTSCYDPKRDRIYVGGGSYPVAKGENALWIFDLKTNTWIDPKPTGKPCGGSNSYATNIAMMHYDAAADAVVLVRHKGTPAERGIFIYDPDENAWSTATTRFPKQWTGNANSGFYDPRRNVHLFHVAGDSRADGVIIAWRYRRAAQPPAPKTD
jgi:hypothetical protein